MTRTDLRAGDVMTADPICASPEDTIRDLVLVFEANDISGAPVINQAGEVIGIVTKTDLICRCPELTAELLPAYVMEFLSERGADEDSGECDRDPLCVKDLMTVNPPMVTTDMPAASVARLMYDKGVHRVIVADEDRFPLGIITSMDLLDAFPQSPPRATYSRASSPEAGRGRITS